MWWPLQQFWPGYHWIGALSIEFSARKLCNSLSSIKTFKDEGRVEGNQSLVLRQLTRRLGEISPAVRSQIEGLSLEQTEALGEALLDFEELGDLLGWLKREQSATG
ncbi:MAG: DUF4351 domain-containing protein [Thermosynechococcaceae cyanobacterium]